MKFKITRKLLISALAAVAAVCFSQTLFAQIAVKGETVFTMAGEPIKNGVVLVKDGKIEAVGAAAQVSIPSGYRVISAKVVTPGLIDAHSVVGLNGYLNQPLTAAARYSPNFERSIHTTRGKYSSNGYVNSVLRPCIRAISPRHLFRARPWSSRPPATRLTT